MRLRKKQYLMIALLASVVAVTIISIVFVFQASLIGGDGSIIIDDSMGAPGFTAQNGDWHVANDPLAYKQQYRYLIPTDTKNTGTWTFTKLPIGSYKVFATWNANAKSLKSFAWNASYLINTGKKDVSLSPVGQNIPPQGDTVDGAVWQLIGWAASTDGTITVQIGNAGAVGQVMADGIRVLRTSDKYYLLGATCSPISATTLDAKVGVPLPIDITYQNTGNSTWTPQGNQLHQMGLSTNVPLPQAVPPGGKITFHTTYTPKVSDFQTVVYQVQQNGINIGFPCGVNVNAAAAVGSDITLGINAVSKQVSYGSEAALYKVVVTNAGPQDATKPASFSLPIPNGLTFNSSDNPLCGVNGRILTCSTGLALAVGAVSTSTISFDVAISMCTGQIEKMTGLASGPDKDPNTINNAAASDPIKVSCSVTSGTNSSVATSAPSLPPTVYSAAGMCKPLPPPPTQVSDQVLNVKGYKNPDGSTPILLAKADGVTDDGPAINAAIKYAAAQNIRNILIPAGTYLIGTQIYIDSSYKQVTLADGAILKAGPTLTWKGVIRIECATDVSILGPGMIDGDKKTSPTAGRYGIHIGTGAQSVLIKGLTIKNMPDSDILGSIGDGIYVAGTSPYVPQDITIEGNTLDNNDRVNIALIQGQRLSVINNVATHGGGTAAGGCGIDIESNRIGDILQDILVSGNTFQDNYGCGISVGSNSAVKQIIDKRVTITNNTVIGEGGIGASRVNGLIIKNNKVTYYDVPNKEGAIQVNDIDQGEISGNEVTGGDYSIGVNSVLGLVKNLSITNNTLSNHAGHFIWIKETITPTEVNQSGNTMTEIK